MISTRTLHLLVVLLSSHEGSSFVLRSPRSTSTRGGSSSLREDNEHRHEHQHGHRHRHGHDRIAFHIIPHGRNGITTTTTVTTTTTRPSSIQLHQSSSSYDSNYSQAQALKRRNVILPLLDFRSDSKHNQMDDDDNNDDDDDDIGGRGFGTSMITTPLPASHLPNELSTLHIYSIQFKAAIHKMAIRDSLEKFSSSSSSSNTVDVDVINYRPNEPMYGHVVGRSTTATTATTVGADENDVDSRNDGSSSSLSSLLSGSSLVGSIGCASEILVATPSDMLMQVGDDTGPGTGYNYDVGVDMDDDSTNTNTNTNTNTEDGDMTVLSKGSFRFIIKNITQTFPYPIAIVDELLDDCIDNNNNNNNDNDNGDNNNNNPAATTAIKEEIFYDDLGTFDDEVDDEDDEDEEDDNEDEDMYAHLTPKELTERIFSAMKAIVDQKLDTKPKKISPLEASILEQNGMSPEIASMMGSMQQDYAEEMAAVLDIFMTELIDIVPLSSKTERYYVIAMFAAEFGGLDNEVRKNILVGLDGVERLRVVLEGLEKKISLVQAKKLTEGIVEKSDESSKDLLVGKPALPPWATSLKEGMKIEYYWSEKDGWLCGTIVETATIVDELIITVLFDDGETVRLPFDPEQKVRWRPAGM